MKLVAISGGKLLSKDMYLSLGFGSHPCELSTLTLMLWPSPGAAEVAEALRDLADSVEKLEDKGEYDFALPDSAATVRKMSKELEAAWDALLRAGTESPRRGGKKTRSRSVAPAPQPEKSMANKKTAKKRAKKMAKASKKPC